MKAGFLASGLVVPCATIRETSVHGLNLRSQQPFRREENPLDVHGEPRLNVGEDHGRTERELIFEFVQEARSNGEHHASIQWSTADPVRGT